ncbi:MAG: phosphotransferase [Eubacteriaceae bacterium]|nr:phosphotransferase [Eubacteriaceae bacterium]
MELTKINIDPSGFPESIIPYLTDCDIYDSSCHSEAKVYYSSKGYFIKTAPKGTLFTEAENAKAFYEKGVGVKVIRYVSEEKDYLVTQKAVGEDLTHFKGSVEEICEIIIDSMSQIHAYEEVNVGISFAMKHYDSFEPKNENADITEFTNLLGVTSAEKAREIIIKNRGILRCESLIHGDMCLPNIIRADDGKITFIDLGYAGMGDKNIDVYWAAWTLWYNIGLDAAELFLEKYTGYSSSAVSYIAACEALS